MSRRPSLCVALAAMLAGCAHASGQAMLRPVCAPNDAAATELTVQTTTAEYPQFRLRVDHPLAQVAGTRVSVTNPDAAGPYAQWCDSNGCRVVRPGPTTVTFGPLRSDSSTTVDVRTTRGDGRPFAWKGVARWKTNGQPLVCG